MQPTLLQPLFHRGGEQIGIFFPKNEEINSIVRKIKGIKWSQTHKCWYLPLNHASFGHWRNDNQEMYNIKRLKINIDMLHLIA
jgi:hypothetical protein